MAAEHIVWKRGFKKGKEKTLYNLLSSSLIFLRFQSLLKVLYLTTKLSTRARRFKIKLLIRLVNRKQDSLFTAAQRIRY